MHVRELTELIGKPALPTVLLFCPGAGRQKESFEPLLADRAIQHLIAHYVPEGMHDLAYRMFYADESSPGEIVQEAQTLPFLSERRVILVRNAERYDTMSGEKGSPLAPLIEYLKSPADTTLLILVAAQADKRKKLYKSCSVLKALIECPQLEENEIAQWIREETQRKGKQIEPGAVSELIARAGQRLSDIQNAIELVSNYVGAAQTIRDADVIAACADVAEETVWALTDAIAESDPDKAIHILQQLLDLGKSPDEIMGLINWLLESAYRATPASHTGLKSKFVERKVAPLVKKLGVEKIKAALALCTDTHFMLRSTGVDRTLALELLVIKLAASRRKPVRA